MQTCLRAGLVGGETFATDASVIEADARIARCTEDKESPDDWDDPNNVTRPVREYLDQLDKAAGLDRLRRSWRWRESCSSHSGNM